MVLQGFCQGGAGPHKCSILRGNSQVFQGYAKTAAKELRAAKQSGQVAATAKALFESPVQAAKLQGTKRAREALMKKAEEVECRRRVKLGD